MPRCHGTDGRRQDSSKILEPHWLCLTFFDGGGHNFSGEQRSSVLTLGLSGGDDLEFCVKHRYITGEGILLHFTVPVVHRRVRHKSKGKGYAAPSGFRDTRKVSFQGEK